MDRAPTPHDACTATSPCALVLLPQREDASIEWALLDGLPVHVSDPKVRGGVVCVCPGCGRRLVPRKGATRRWHFAHLDTMVSCDLLSRESREHMNTKLSLASALIAAEDRRLTLSFRCRERGRAAHKVLPLRPWATRWDDVRVEHALGGIRADIALLRGGTVIAIVEVCASNPVDASKAEKLRSLDVPWIEIGVGTNVPASSPNAPPEERWRWDLTRPIEVLRAGPDAWACPVCRAYGAAGERVAGDGWSSWVERVEAALREGRCTTVWQRTIRTTASTSTVVTSLQIIDIADDRGVLEQRVLCLDNPIWRLAEWWPGRCSVDSGRHDFRAQQRAFLARLRSIVSIVVAAWEQQAPPLAFVNPWEHPEDLPPTSVVREHSALGEHSESRTDPPWDPRSHPSALRSAPCDPTPSLPTTAPPGAAGCRRSSARRGARHAPRPRSPRLGSTPA